MAEHGAGGAGFDSLLAALEAEGAAQRDPVAFHTLRGLARRAAAQHGPLRAWLTARVQTRAEAVRAAAAAPAVAAPPHSPAPAQPDSPLSVLRAALPPTEGAAEPKALRWYGAHWSRLRVEQRLDQALATVPDKAGPLNTPRLLHETLAAMQALSPAYLQQFVAHVDALLALDAALGNTPGDRAAAPERKKAGGPRKAAPPARG